MKVVLAKSALSDLQEIRGHYPEQGLPEVGQRLVNDILKHVQHLADHPDLGRKVPEFDQENIREIIHPPFRIVYLRNPSKINLIRVWRSERLLMLPDSGDAPDL